MNVKLIRKDGTTETMTAAELASLRSSLNNLVQNGDDQDGVQPVKREITDAQQAESEARAIEAAQVAATDAAIASIYTHVTYNGKDYPVDPLSMAKYELAKQSRGRGKATKGVAVATDGSILKLSTPTEIDNFHSAMEDAIVARLHAAHDAL